MALSSSMRHPVLPMVAAMVVLAAVELARAQALTSVSDLETPRLNEVAAVVAGTWESEEEDTFLTLGAEYERRITSRVGLIAEIEYLFDAESWVVAAPLVFRPARGVKLFGGPGFEHAQPEQDESLEGPGADDSEGSDTRFLFRVGAAYAVEFSERYSIGPSLSMDFVQAHGDWAHAVVFGVTVGVGF